MIEKRCYNVHKLTRKFPQERAFEMLSSVRQKILERHRSSLFLRMGIPALTVGVVTGIPGLIAGINYNLLGSPVYWQGFGFCVTFVLLGAVCTAWGWFKDPVQMR